MNWMIIAILGGAAALIFLVAWCYEIHQGDYAENMSSEVIHELRDQIREYEHTTQELLFLFEELRDRIEQQTEQVDILLHERDELLKKGGDDNAEE